jgi:hypothetical protein
MVVLEVRLVGVSRMQPKYLQRRGPGTHGVPFLWLVRYESEVSASLWGRATNTQNLDHMIA